jgi:hypothetical protein
MAGLADQVHDCPVSLAHLNFVELEANQLGSAQAATEQHGKHGVVARGTKAPASGMFENFRTLLDGQPVARAKPELLHAFHAADSRRQLRAQQAGISGFVSQTTHGCKLLIDGVCGQTAGFQVHAVADDHDAVER